MQILQIPALVILQAYVAYESAAKPAAFIYYTTVWMYRELF